PAEAGATGERRSRAPVVLAFLLTALVGFGAWTLISWARGGAACEAGAFESPRFGYCVRAPGGWTAEAAGDEGPALDRFILPDGPATITVTAVRLSKGQDLARFEQFVRGFDEDAGATLGESAQAEVGGAMGVTFDVTMEDGDGTTLGREVLFVREGTAWRVQLADDEPGFEASAHQLDEMLASWRFT
ncbi:MAG: hypothetical protein ACRDHI_14360, partial [Actinomycetota bacterium]